MGITFATARVSNARRPGKRAESVEFLVDTGAIFSVVPARVLKELGIDAMQRETLTMADGSHVIYPIGEAFFEFEGKAGTSKVVFGPAGATPLLGALTLESLGLMVNPVTRELKPMRLLPMAAPTRRVRSTKSGERRRG